MTFDSLPAADREAFAQWKQRVIKDCAWQQALPSLAEEFAADGPPYVASAWIDLRALRAVTGDRPLVSGASGQLVLLDPPTQDSLVVRSARSARRTVDGKARVFEARADREDGVCVITLDGEELFRGELPASMPVIASYDGQALAGAGPALAPLLAGRAGADEVAAIEGASLLAPALAALVPTMRAHSVLAQAFAATEDEVRGVFPLRTSRAPDVAQLRSVPTATPFAPRTRIYGATASLAPIYDGGAVQAELLYDGLHADLIAIRAELSVAVGGTNVALVAITAAPSVAHDDEASRRCFLARALASRFEPIQPRSPAFDTQLAGCAHLAVDAYAALAGGVDTRRAIATTAIVPGVTPGAYRGWDQALIEVARRMDAQGVALTELDPTKTIPELTTVLDRHATVTGAITDPAARAALGDAVIGLVFRWLFNAVVPPSALVATIGTALSNAAVGYPDSARQMLADLGDGVESLDAGPRAVDCGLALVGDRRAQVDHALAAVTQVPFSEGFVGELRGHVLQTCPDAAALVRLEISAPAVSAFVAADRARADDSFTFKLDIAPLVDRALEQTWTSATFDALGDLLGFARISDATFCASHASMAEQIACIDPTLERFSAAVDDGVLAPAVAARYAAMARELMARWPALADLQFSSTRFDITDAWADGVWRGCSDAGFDRARQRLYTLLDALRAATTSDARFELEAQIATLVAAKTCA